MRSAKGFAGILVLGLALWSASGANAASEVGSHCDANVVYIPGIEGTIFPLAAASPDALPTSSPINGVATSWTVHNPSSDSFQQRLKVLRTLPGTDSVLAIAEAGPESVSKGKGPFPIRIPVLAGDRFGLNSPEGGALACSSGPGDTIGTTVRNPKPGESERYFPDGGHQVALSVMVEPDLDGDGYGDETQEPCPEAITVQAPCPNVTWNQRTELKKRVILVHVEISSQATVQVFGQVAWRVRSSEDRAHRLTIALDGGRARTISPPREATFRLPLSKAVLRRLERLGSAHALRAKLTAEVTDLAGRISHRQFRFLLPGRG